MVIISSSFIVGLYSFFGDAGPSGRGAVAVELQAGCGQPAAGGTPPITDTFRAGPGWKWGYGLLLNTADVPGRRRAGTGSWAGLFNTHFFIDRTTGICASIYTNSLPFIEQDGAWAVYGEFEDALYAAL